MPEPGDNIEGYILETLIARDGWSTTWEAEHEVIGSRHRLQVLNDEWRNDETARERFLADVTALGEVGSRNIIAVAAILNDADAVGVALEQVAGESLRRVIADGRGPKDLNGLVEVFGPLLEGLGTAHDAGVIHRQITPTRIVIRLDAVGVPCPVLVDFALASRPEEGDARPAGPSLIRGDLRYKAPEQMMEGDVDQRADVFALGAVLYEVVTGQPAFGDLSGFETLRAVVMGRYPRVPQSVSATYPGLAHVIGRALSRDPAKRYPNCEALLHDLREARDGLLASEPVRTTTSRPRFGSSTRAMVMSLVAGLALTVALPVALVCGGFMFVIAGALVGQIEAADDEVAMEIRAIPYDGGLSDWDDAVSRILLTHHDWDGSGSLQTSDEAGAVSCPTWWAIDDGVREEWSSSVRVIYGSESDLAWLGGSLGIDVSQREFVDDRMQACGIEGADIGPAFMDSPFEESMGDVEGDPTLPDLTEWPVVPPDVAQAIRSIPDGGTASWDHRVAPLMVRAYDADESGWVDTAEELALVPCEVWHALDGGVREEWSSGIRVVYGFESRQGWLGYLVGIAEPVGQHADAAMSGCGVPSGAGELAEAAFDETAIQAGPVAALQAVVDEGGSSDWDSSSQVILLLFYDGDESGLIDTFEEVAAIPCDVWEVLDSRVREQWSAGLRTTYGFDSGGWLGYLLGFSEGIRRDVDQRLETCLSGEERPHLEASEPDIRALPDVIRSLSDGDGEWSDAVRTRLIFHFDSDGSGMLDRPEELQMVPCEVWLAIDREVRNDWGSGLFKIYGITDGVWVAEEFGLDEMNREALISTCQACGLVR